MKTNNSLRMPNPLSSITSFFHEKSAYIGTLAILGIFLALWHGVSLFYSPLVAPSPALTMRTLIEIVQSDEFITEIVVTLERLLEGIIKSVLVGSTLGILMGISKSCRSLFEPVVYLIQSIPPILFITLAMIWFGLDGQATVFIVFLTSVPIMAINIKEGFENVDIKLIEMGKAFKFSRMKMIVEIIIPSLKTHFKSGLIIVVGLGWKMVIMGELLSAGNGLGAQIYDARMSMQTNKVFAWGFIVIVFSFLLQKISATMMDLKPLRRKKYDFEN